MMNNDPRNTRQPAAEPNHETTAGPVPKVGFTPTVESSSQLGEDLITNWVGNGGAPRVPANRRDEVVATLTRCMVDDQVLAAYAGALESGWIEHGGRSPIAGYPSYELPEEQIVRDGFTALDERALGDIAVCPSAVRALRDVLRTVPATVEEFVDPGDWFYDELDKVDPNVQGTKSTREIATEALTALLAQKLNENP